MNARLGAPRGARRIIAGFAAAGSLGAAISTLPATANVPVVSASDDGTVGVYVDEAADVSTLQAAGGRQVADYGSYSLWRVAASTPLDATTMSSAGNLDKIELRGGAINAATDTEPEVNAALRDAASGGKQLRIVQFGGPILPAWVDGLKAIGLRTVSYLPPNAYVVFGDAAAADKLAALADSDPLITYEGPFRPAYRLAPDLEQVRASGQGTVDVVVQVVEGEAADIAAVKATGTPLAGDNTVAGFTNLELRVPAAALTGLVRMPGVVNVARRVVPVRQDEAQGQIVAGNVQTVGGKRVPTGPGYLAYLTSKGIPTDFISHPRVAVVDDGVDNGTTNPLHNDFRHLGIGSNPSRITANVDCTGGGNPRAIAGHGNINAGIIGGYNNGTGATNEDGNGFNYGLGIDPYARMSNIKIFTDAGGFSTGACAGGTYRGIVEQAVAQQASITSNSWGANVGGAYDVASQEYDAYTRDASTAGGVQPLFHVFSAGNAGSGPNTIGSPGTAKNVLTVGATENVRDQGVADGCAISDGDNADDMATFSSRGPTDDLRAKPDIVAPGTHVQGPASQAPGYNGTGVCGPIYYPLGGQTLYTWSSGTSHSAPAVSGAAALASEYYRRVLNPGVTPSPAMLKALVLNTPRYLNGLATGGTLPGTGQGWGDVNLSQLYAANRIVDDQSHLFTSSGQRTYRYFTAASSTKPTRITLAYSDAPGATVGNSYVNDLDLLVVAGGKLYRGNVFNGATSTTGGSPDPRNNVEQVWLPAGLTGRVTVQVLARTIAGDGVPGGTALDQDFALSGLNLTPASATSNVPYMHSNTASATGPGTNGDSGISPGEPVAISVRVGNLGPSATAAGTLTASIDSGPGGMIVSSVSVPSVAANSTQLISGLKMWVLPTAVCNTSVVNVRLRYTSGSQAAVMIAKVVPTAPFVSINSSDVPKNIADNATASSTLTAGPRTVKGIRVRLNITHTYDSDLVLRLTGPGAQQSTLANHRGGNGDNFANTVFDDNAATPISGGAAPFTGSFQPDTPLATFLNTNAAGTWTLTAQDTVTADTGTLNSWGLDLQGATCPALTTRGVAVVNAPNTTEGDGGGTKSMAFKVIRTGPVGAGMDVRVSTANGSATAPGDYTARSNVLVHFNAGETTKTVNVSIRKDNTNESNETVRLNLTSKPASVVTVRGAATGTIIDDD